MTWLRVDRTSLPPESPSQVLGKASIEIGGQNRIRQADLPEVIATDPDRTDSLFADRSLPSRIATDETLGEQRRPATESSAVRQFDEPFQHDIGDAIAGRAMRNTLPLLDFDIYRHRKRHQNPRPSHATE